MTGDFQRHLRTKMELFILVHDVIQASRVVPGLRLCTISP